jgi:hypothetical protein
VYLVFQTRMLKIKSVPLKKPSTRKSADIMEEIISLETKLENYKILLNKSIDARDEFQKTRSILHEMRIIKERLEQIQGSS